MKILHHCVCGSVFIFKFIYLLCMYKVKYLIRIHTVKQSILVKEIYNVL